MFSSCIHYSVFMNRFHTHIIILVSKTFRKTHWSVFYILNFDIQIPAAWDRARAKAKGTACPCLLIMNAALSGFDGLHFTSGQHRSEWSCIINMDYTD